ncbi:MAG: DNA phosphorothioation system sulfurtransferase DndC [Flavobacteriales bacterium]|nr:DNA phosphorothioation system sulfurtransferase DndC [Flavobacteriales bacterium]
MINLKDLNQIKNLISKEYFNGSLTPWIIAYSGGKDSTLLLNLTLDEITKKNHNLIKRKIFIVSNDTLVESPLIKEHLYDSIDKINNFCKVNKLPISAHITKPEFNKSFWVNLVGKGYPSPKSNFRWCTDRLKIEPTTNFIVNTISENGKVILLLGVRKSESATRARSIRKNQNQNEVYDNHQELKNCKTFSPIVNLTDDDIWTVLLQSRPVWGGDFRRLITLYKNAGGDCPLVMSKNDAPSCGSSSARFGCWTCTVVKKDRSMDGLIESGHQFLEDLADFREWLVEIRDVPENRLPFSRRWQVRKREDGTIMPGPFTIELRKGILEKLLNMQIETKMDLISEDEIEEIKRIWKRDELVLKCLNTDTKRLKVVCGPKEEIL